MALILLVMLGRILVYRPAPLVGWEGWALALGSLGVILAVLGGHMTMTWPLGPASVKFKNFLFGEPALVLGVLLVAAAMFLWRRGAELAVPPENGKFTVDVLAVARPVALIVAAQGLVMVSNTWGSIANGAFSTPPKEEPIFGTWPVWFTSTYHTSMLAFAALGALAFLPAVWRRSRVAMIVIAVAWGIAGVGYLLAGVTVYGAHIYMHYNLLAS